MFSLVELRTSPLHQGIPGVSPTHMLLIFLVTFAIPLILYAFMYHSLPNEQRRVARVLRVSPIRAWMQAHRHPALLHH